MKLEDYFKNGKVYVWQESFAIVKSRKVYNKAFANIIDKKEITVITNQAEVNNEDVIEIEKDWKILTFDMVLPFELTGFLAKVSQVLADEQISIFAVSAYSTDHLLVKEKNLKKALKKLENLGFIIERK